MVYSVKGSCTTDNTAEGFEQGRAAFLGDLFGEPRHDLDPPTEGQACVSVFSSLAGVGFSGSFFSGSGFFLLLEG
jgi:hypothetical protein